MPDIMTVAQARAIGSKYYFTGRPCKHGHIDVRLITGGCYTCKKLNTSSQKRANAEHYKQKTHEWRVANRDRTREIQRAYYARNAAAIRAEQSFIRAERLKRVVPWSEKELIEEFFANCPDGMSVDHVIPLQGELVSGLHVRANLQYLDLNLNKAKNNRFDIEEFNA